MDFYLPEYNIAIECQGIQHFESRDLFGGKEYLLKINKLDKKKKEKCDKHDVKILYFSDINKYNVFLGEEIIKNSEKLVNIIKNGKGLL